MSWLNIGKTRKTDSLLGDAREEDGANVLHGGGTAHQWDATSVEAGPSATLQKHSALQITAPVRSSNKHDPASSTLGSLVNYSSSDEDS